ncbi:methyltransferase domain-containing protein [candidate division KSB1 bacterium]|nr:methyltransferase domain-containing protein [candidate division KSB1 bacterium]
MSQRVCPWWVGYILLVPFRKLRHDPEKILGPYVNPGMKVLEVGPGMGFFTVPLAQMVGESGQVISVDVQEKMISKLRKRAAKRDLLDRLDMRICSAESLQIPDLSGQVDFTLAFAVMHEVPKQENFLHEIYDAMRPAGLLLISEPAGHVSESDFVSTEKAAEQQGFVVVQRPRVKKTLSVLMRKELSNSLY